MPLAVPRSLDDITPDWFVGALSEHSGRTIDLADMTVEPMEESRGLIGDLAIVRTVHDHGDLPTSFVLKLPAADPTSRRIGQMLNAYGREVAFYHHVAPRCPDVRIPRCWYAAEDPATGDAAILLDHIDADPVDDTTGASTAQIRAAIDALADFHCTWWGHDPFDWMPGFDRGGVGRLQPLWLENLPTFVERYADVLPGPTSAWVLGFAPKLADWSDATARGPLTMVHADYRIDNLLFTGPEVTMIDWQTALRGPAAMDLSSLLLTGLTIDDRRRDEAEHIDRYLDRLGLDIDREWFVHSYDENVLWWMGQFGNNLAHLDPPTEAMATALTETARRVFTAGLDRDVERLLT